MAITLDQSTKKVKLDLDGLTRDGRVEAKIAAGEIIVEEINRYLDRAESPVEGGKYKKKKVDGTISDLFEDGDMRAHITFEESEDGIIVGIFDDAPDIERTKAFAHNTGYRGHPHLSSPKNKREFIPTSRKGFKESIMRRVNSEINDIRNEEEFDKFEQLTNIDIQPSIESVFDIGNEALDKLILKALSGN